MKKAWLFLSFTFVISFVGGQNRKVDKLVFPSEQYPNPVTFVNCDSNGLCVLAQSADMGTDSVVWNIFHYDVDFNLVHQAAFNLSKTQRCLEVAYDKGDFVILFRNEVKRRKNHTGCVAHYNIYDRSVHVESIEQLPDAMTWGLNVHDGHLLFACRHGRRSEDLLYYKLGTRFVKPLAIENPSNYSVRDFMFDTIRKKVIACLQTESNPKTDPILWLYETDFEGNLQYAIEFPDNLDIHFLNVRIQPIDSAEFLFLGTYKERQNVLEYSSADGIYLLHFKDGNFDEPRYYPFESGKPPVQKLFNRANVDFIIDDLIQNQNGFSVIVESYHPVYREISRFDEHGGTFTYDVLIGFNFINAYVKTFDQRGKILWEYTLPFDNMMVHEVESHLKLSLFPQQILFYYLKGAQIVTLLTDNDLNIIEPLRNTSLQALEENTSTDIYYSNSQLIPWYGNNYLLTFNKSFKTKRYDEDHSVFYIYKLKFQ